MTISKRVEMDYAVLELTERGIFIARYKKGIELDERMARAVLAVQVEMCGDRLPAPVLACLDQIKAFTREARQFFAESDENIAASSRVALLVSSPIARTIANFFLGISKPRVPTRSFTSEDKAIAWLAQGSGVPRR